MIFFCKLLAPRPSFIQDMTPAEHELMGEHARYWREWLAKGNVKTFGMVADPRGAYGIGIVEFDSEMDARAFGDGDPTIRSGQGFQFEIMPMPMGAITA